MSARVLFALTAFALGSLDIAPGVAHAQNYAPHYTPTPKTDFQRAIDNAPQQARQPPPTPPSTTHENRLPAGPHGSVGGDFGKGGGSLNYKRDFR